MPNVAQRVPSLTTQSRAGERALQQNINATGQVISAMGQLNSQTTNALQQFTNYAMQVAGDIAKVEGQEFGIDKANELKGLAGEDLLQALNRETPGDKFSIYGSAARSAYVNEVYNKVSYDTSLQIQEASINSYDKNTGLPNRNPDDLKRQINDIVQKNTAALSKVSVVAGTKLGAQLSVQGLDGYKVYLSDWLKERSKQKKSQTQREMVNLTTQISPSLLSGNFEHIADLKKEYLDKAQKQGFNVLEADNQFNAKLETHKKQAFFKLAGSEGLRNVLADIVTDQTLDKTNNKILKSLWNSINNKPAIIQEMISLDGQEDTLRNRELDEAQDNRKENIRVLGQKYFTSNNNAERSLIINQLRSIGVEGKDLVDKLISGDQIDPIQEQLLEEKAALGKLTFDDVRNSGAKGKTLGKYLQLVETQISENKLVQEPLQRLKAIMLKGYAGQFTFTTQQQKSEKDQLIRKYEGYVRELNEKLRTDETFNLTDASRWVDEKIEKYLIDPERKDNFTKKLTEVYGADNKVNGLPGFRESQSLAAQIILVNSFIQKQTNKKYFKKDITIYTKWIESVNNLKEMGFSDKEIFEKKINAGN